MKGGLSYLVAISAGLLLFAPVFNSPVQAATQSCDFTRSLYLGVSGSDVLCLQQYLNLSGFIVALSGPGSPGNETNHFGPLVEKAVTDWQIANNISPASGYFGPTSRQVFGALSAPPTVMNDNEEPFLQTNYTVSLDGNLYTVKTADLDGKQVRAVYDSNGQFVHDFDTVLKVMQAGWAYEQYISQPSLIIGQASTIQDLITNDSLLRVYDTTMDVLERSGVEAVVAFGTGGTDIPQQTADLINSTLKDSAFDPKLYAALLAEHQLQTAISDYQQMAGLLSTVKQGQSIDGKQAIQIRNLYLEAHPLDLKFLSLLPLLHDQNFSDEIGNLKANVTDQMEGYVTPDDLSLLNTVTSLNENIDNLLATFQDPANTFSADIKQAANEKPDSDSTVTSWASMAVMVNATPDTTSGNVTTPSGPSATFPVTSSTNTTTAPSPVTVGNTNDSLQAQLNALLQELASLQAQTQMQQGTAATSSSPTPPSSTSGNTLTPTAHIMATNMNVSPGGATIIYWTSTNAGTCTVSPTNWSGTNVPQSAGWLQTLESTETYTLTCLGSGGTATNSVTVTVTSASAPAQTTSLPTDWIALLSQYASNWNAQGYTSGYITDSYGVTRWYKLEGNSWVQVSNQAEAQAAPPQNPLLVISNVGSSYQFPIGTPVYHSVYFQSSGNVGTTPFNYGATGMPPGLSIDSTGGVIGTPIQTGSFPVTVTITDATGRTGIGSFTFTVTNANSLVIQDSSANSAPNETLPSGMVGSSYRQTLQTYGGIAGQNGFTWSTQGTLPPGITLGTQSCSFNTCTVPISGTPTQGGTYTFQVIATDSVGTTAQKNITITVNTGTPPQIASSWLPLATIGQPYNYTFTATGGSGGYQWSFTGASPDPGLQLSSGGVLSGTTANPNDCQNGPGYGAGVQQSIFNKNYSASFTVTVKDSSGQSASTQPLCLVSYYPQPQVTSVNPSSLTIDGAQHVVTVTGSNFRSDAIVQIGGGGTSPVPTTYISPTTLSFTMYPSSLNGGGFTLTPGATTVFTAGQEQVDVFQSYSTMSSKVGWTIASP